MKKIRILIVDDHKLIRDTWCFILQREPDFEVIGSCSTAEDGLALAKALHPDVILLDVNLPGMNGVEVAAQCRRDCPSSRVVGLSIHTDPSYAKQMTENGAMGYVTKGSSRQEIFEAIREVYQGRKYFSKEVRDRVV